MTLDYVSRALPSGLCARLGEGKLAGGGLVRVCGSAAGGPRPGTRKTMLAVSSA